MQASSLAYSVSDSLLSSVSAPLPLTYTQAVLDVVSAVSSAHASSTAAINNSAVQTTVALALAKSSTGALESVARGVL